MEVIMDRINQRFQDELALKRFDMAAIEGEQDWIYKGRFAYRDLHIIDFAVSLTKNETKSFGQIVFNNIAYCRQTDSRLEWLDLINRLNQEQTIFYSVCLSEDNSVFMRYVTEVSDDLPNFVNILIQGPTLVSNLLKEIEDHFGTFLVL